MSHLRHHACEFWVRQISRSRWKSWMSLRLIGRYNDVNEKNIKQVSHLPCRSHFYPKDTLTVIPDSRQRLQKWLGGQCVGSLWLKGPKKLKMYWYVLVNIVQVLGEPRKAVDSMGRQHLPLLQRYAVELRDFLVDSCQESWRDNGTSYRPLKA